MGDCLRTRVHQPPRSTQPSTICETLKCVSAFGLVNNKWRWRMQMLPKRDLTAQAAQLGRKVCGHLALFLHSSREPGELSQWLCRDDSSINIVFDMAVIFARRYCDRACLFVGWFVRSFVTLVVTSRKEGLQVRFSRNLSRIFSIGAICRH